MIKNIIIILIILAIIFLSQQPYFEKLGNKAVEWGRVIWEKCYNFFQKNIFSKATSEIEKRQNIAKEEIKQQTKEVSQNIWEKTKNYLFGLFQGLFSQTPN